MVRDYYETFGFEDYYFRLSLWDSNSTEKYIGSKENWETTQNHLRKILNELEVPYEESEGEAAFYGPKIDIKIKENLDKVTTNVRKVIKPSSSEREKHNNYLKTQLQKNFYN